MTLELRDSAAPERPATAADVQACARDGGALKVLVVVGHPRRQSLCQALAGAYGAGARRAGAEVRELRLCELSFDPNVRSFDPLEQPREDAIVQAQALLVWADHVVFVYPTWWGTIPALLKGFLDRVLAPGFAFADNGPGFAPLLTGRSAELLTTMDTPRWVYRWIYGAPGHKAMARAILGFCGIDVVRVASFGPVRNSDPGERRSWLDAAQQRGLKLRAGVLPRRRKVLRKVASWLQALRLQFYPMAWLAYLVGALAALQLEGSFAPAAFWWGLLCLFALEVAAVLTNETYDVETDRRNRNHGPFTGGSRVLIDGKLSLGEVRSAIVAALGVAAGSAAAALAAAPNGAAVLVLAPLTVLALGYTAPPLELCYRGLGELDVGITHSLCAVLCGFMFQGGAWSAPEPWLLSLPLFLAVLPSITLAGVPDADADRLAGKGTLAVRAGVRGAYRVAAIWTVLAAAAAIALTHVDVVRQLFAGIEYPVVAHAALLLAALAGHARAEAASRRIDGLMALALSYILWFVAIPLWHLLRLHPAWG